MSRTTQFIGFPAGYNQLLFSKIDASKTGCVTCKRRGQEYVPRCKVRPTKEIVTGMFEEEVHHCNEYLSDQNEVIYREVEQCSPWSSGPNIFMKLVDGDGNDVLFWVQEEIDSHL